MGTGLAERHVSHISFCLSLSLPLSFSSSPFFCLAVVAFVSLFICPSGSDDSLDGESLRIGFSLRGGDADGDADGDAGAGSPAFFFHGAMSDIAIFKGALPADVVAEQYRLMKKRLRKQQ